ncbi:DUF1697 domain-containing protein [Gemmatimonadota bacterium]
MKTFIALLRGINVGGKNILPMKELVSVLESLGLHNVKTYIQSGNVVFQSKTTDEEELSLAIKAAIVKSHGIKPDVLILSQDRLREALAVNPFPDGEIEPKTLHLCFLASQPSNPDIERLEAVRADSESFKLIDAVLYLHAPDGIARSKLAATVEKAMGVPSTARNWRSASKIMSMAEDLAE